MTRRPGDTTGVLAVIGLGAAVVLCCAGPVLIGAGALGVLGGALRSWWLIGAAVVLALSAAAYTTVRHARRHARGHDGADACRPPATHPSAASRPAAASDGCCPPNAAIGTPPPSPAAGEHRP
jgi:hypothetical protein